MISSKTRGGLVLTRRVREGQDSIVIDDRIVIQVIQIKGGTVRLRFVTPEGTMVVREEIRNGFVKTK